MKRASFLILFFIPCLIPSFLSAQVKGNAYRQQVRNMPVQTTTTISGYSGSTIQNNNANYQRQQQSTNQYGYSWDAGLNWTNPNLVITSNDVMEFEVSAIMNVEAESYLAIFNITQPGETAAEADKLLNERLDKLKEDLKVLGVTETDFYVDVVSLVPLYEFEVEKKLFSKNYNEVPKGFELQKNIHISYVQSDLLDDILTAAARQEIYELVKVDYIVKSPEEAYKQMRQKAIANMNEKVADFEKLEVKLDTVFRQISEGKGVAYPISRYQSYQSAQSTSLQKTGRGEVTKIRKPEAYYYNALPYDLFDIVINPEYLEPVVQYTYKLKVRYVIKPDPVKVKKEFIWLTPDGEMRTLKVEDKK